ncbi:MAG: TIGR02206 family membrane protein [Epulopiscium sp.]|nr:TIGR02206 family membrane protein [Candidatus Epulonipiscium sp.]
MMRDFFGENYKGKAFELFSAEHITVIAIIFACCLMIYLFHHRLKEEKINRRFRHGLAFLLITIEVLYYIWVYVNHLWSFSRELPLHLCDMALIGTIILLFTKSYFLYEFLYFWAMCGVLAALITPELSGYNATHFLFYHFFIGHGLIVIAIIFMTFVNEYRPKVSSIFKTMLISNLYMLFVAAVNLITGGNYLFICRKPQVVSIMDFLGPWPWYILSMELVALVAFLIAYLPFIIYIRLKKSHARKGM